MALTVNEKRALDLILADAEDRGLFTSSSIDPGTDPRAFIKSLVTAARDGLQAQLDGLPALQTKLTNQRNLLNGLLAKFP